MTINSEIMSLTYFLNYHGMSQTYPVSKQSVDIKARSAFWLWINIFRKNFFYKKCKLLLIPKECSEGIRIFFTTLLKLRL